MSANITESISRIWSNMCHKTTEAIAQQEAAWIRGKVAGKPVCDEGGNLLVDAGHPIDAEVIARAKASGKLSALVAAAMTAQAQDLKEKFGEHYSRSPEGQEARALQSADAVVEARRYLGRVLEMDVTDLRGNVIVPAGKPIEQEDIRAAREADQLSALIMAAEQASSVPTGVSAPPLSRQRQDETYAPAPPRPAPTFLVAPTQEEAAEATK